MRVSRAKRRLCPTFGSSLSPSRPCSRSPSTGCMHSPDDTFPHNFLSTSPAHGVPGHSFLYAGPLRSPSPILLELPVAAPKSRDRYANYVWNAGVVLADKIAEGEIDVRGKRVLELGCGLGLPSLLAARMGAELVRFLPHKVRGQMC